MNDLKRKALLFASNAHKDATRKGGLPYILHPVTVGLKLLENGASDELVAAGFLHDTIEDAFVSPETIKKEFGDRVYQLVMFDTENKSLSWEERKNATLKALETCDADCAMLVMSDKLSNILDILESIKQNGDLSTWSVFKRGKEKQEWLYKEYLQVFKRLSHLKMYQELKEVTEEVFEKKTYSNLITITYNDDTTIINVFGSIDINNANEFEDVALNANVLTKGIVINAKELRYISSAGLRVILKIKKKYQDVPLSIINADENIIDILNLTGFSEIIEVIK